MNNEIKEILDNLKDDKQVCSHSYYRLFVNDRDKLLNYITNLEEENKNDYFIHMKEWAKAVGNNVKLQQRIDRAIEVLKLCNSKCAKEVIDILRGEDEFKKSD